MANYPSRRSGRRRVVIWWKGKRKEFIVKGTKADGAAFEARKRLELRATSGPSERRVAGSFFELCEEYAVHAELHLKKSTWRVREFQIDALTSYLGSMRVPEINSGTIDRYKSARLKEKLRPSSVNNELRVLRAIFNWGREVGHEVPVIKWKPLPVRGDPRPKAFSSEEIEQLWAGCRKRTPWLLPMLVFLVNTGCRKGEAIAAEWSWIDFEAGMIRIPSTEHWQPKNGLPREVPLSDKLRAVLSGERKHPRILFPNRSNKAYVEFPKDVWRDAMKEAKLAGGPHKLRHTFASHFLANGGRMEMLAKILGHSDKQITAIYSHLLPGALEHARNLVNLGPPTVGVAVGRKTKKHTKPQKTG